MTALRVYTEYSILRGECRITDIIDRAEELSYTSIAKTDIGTLFGAVEFYEYAKRKKINPIIGCEVTTYIKGEKVTLLLLCENNFGLSSLNIISSYNMMEGLVPENTFLKHSHGIIAIVTGMWEILQSGEENCADILLCLKKYFSKFYAGLELLENESREKTQKIYNFCKKISVDCVIANPVYITKRQNSDVKELLDFIREGKKSDKTCADYLYSPATLEKLFEHLPHVYENTENIGKMCKVEFNTTDMHLPSYPTENAKQLLTEKAFLGLKSKGLTEEKYIKRLENEISVIDKMGFSDYFLITEDFVTFAKSKKIPVGPGRGSGVGSLVAFALGITTVDPVENGLIFERFLNEERVTMPDFDIDFGDERRSEVIDYVRNKYGKKHVCGIVNFSRFAFRQSIRDVAKYKGTNLDNIIKLIPDRIGITVDEAISENHELEKILLSDPFYRSVVKMCKALEGRPRTVSVHPSGIIVTPKPLVSYVPLMKWGDVTITQYPMDICAKIGLLKIDFLGIKFLTVIDKAKRYIRENVTEGYPATDEKPPFDKKVFDMLCKGESGGVFQLESAGMKELLTKLKPCNIDDITAVISLYRPGPKVYIDEYIKGKNNPAAVIYPFPQSVDALKETYGCPIYQEQVMRLCRDAAGFTLGHADSVRRAMAKKDNSSMEREKEAFVKGCGQNGIDAESAKALFSKISGFAKYAFNKSHAAAYALLAYETAYLKCMYPREYFAARLDSVKESFSKIHQYSLDMRKMSIELMPPCINKSDSNFSPCEKGVRYGLSAVKNVGDVTAKKIINERECSGEFKTADDFIWRMGSKIDKMSAMSLVMAGALDVFGETRATLVNLCNDNISSMSFSAASEDQLSLSFGDTEYKYKRREEAEYDETSLRVYEKEFTGVDFYFALNQNKKEYALYIKLTKENKRFLPRITAKLTVKGGTNIVRLYDEETGKTMGMKDASFAPSALFIKELEQFMGDGNVKLKALERNNK